MKKNGIDFFPVHVNVMSDFKVRRLIKACGLSSAAIVLELLGRIYEYEGYFILCNREMVFAIADFLGTTEEEICRVIRKAVEYDLFDETKFRTYGILTSREIQHNFLFATKRRKEVVLIPEYAFPEDPETDVSKETLSVQYVNAMYTEIDLNAKDVYTNEHSLNSIDSSYSTDISLNPNLNKTEEGEGGGRARVIAPPIPSSSPSPPSWRSDFKVYLNELGWAYKYLSEDQEYIQQKERFYPGIDVIGTLEKIIIEFWSTEKGWECKKKKPGNKIDWKLTFDQQMSHEYNQVKS